MATARRELGHLTPAIRSRWGAPHCDLEQTLWLYPRWPGHACGQRLTSRQERHYRARSFDHDVERVFADSGFVSHHAIS
eukprot:8961568-Pyramimonas_sp.AAC.1